MAFSGVIDNVDRESRGLVWVAADRWNHSVGSEFESSSSSRKRLFDGLIGGLAETTCSSFSTRFLRLAFAVSNNEWRASFKDSIIGLTM